MNYLKLIANAVYSGLYVSCLIVFLLLFLNADPAAGARGVATFGKLLAWTMPIYLPLTACLLPTLFLFVRFFAVRRLHAHWFSLKATVWFAVSALGYLTVVYYVNLYWSVSLVAPTTRVALRVCAATMAGCCLLALGATSAGQFRKGAPARRWREIAVLFLLAPLIVNASTLVGLGKAAGTPDHPNPGRLVVEGVNPEQAGGGRRLLVVGLDAASMDQILPLASVRELPAFERFLEQGAWGRLNSLRPCLSGVAWATLLTGTMPWTSGVRADSIFHLLPGGETLQVLPRGLGMEGLEGIGYIHSAADTAARRRSVTLWEILESAGRPVRLIGWDGQRPPSRMNASAGTSRVQEQLERLVGGALPPRPGDRALMSILREAIAVDLENRREALRAWEEGPPQGPMVVAVRLRGLGQTSRYFLRYHMPEEFGDVTPEETERFGKVLSRYYVFLDELLAEQMAAAGKEALVLVVSSYGVEPIPGLTRFSRILLGGRGGGGPVSSGSWDRGPDGLLMVRGPGIAAGARIEEADLVDVVPTVLYALGLPIGRDMTGDLQRRIFKPGFLASHTVHFIPGYPPPATMR